MMTMLLCFCSAAMMFVRREVAFSIRMMMNRKCGVDGVAFFGWTWTDSRGTS